MTICGQLGDVETHSAPIRAQAASLRPGTRHRLRCGYCRRLAGGEHDSSACHEIISPEHPQERRLNTDSNSVSTVNPIGLSPFSCGLRPTLIAAILFKSRRLNQGASSRPLFTIS